MIPGFTAIDTRTARLHGQGVMQAWDDPWKDPNKEFCRPDHTDTFCTGVVLWCVDHFLCYTARTGFYDKARTPYPCGVCVGVSDPSDW